MPRLQPCAFSAKYCKVVGRVWRGKRRNSSLGEIEVFIFVTHGITTSEIMMRAMMVPAEYPKKMVSNATHLLASEVAQNISVVIPGTSPSLSSVSGEKFKFKFHWCYCTCFPSSKTNILCLHLSSQSILLTPNSYGFIPRSVKAERKLTSMEPI